MKAMNLTKETIAQVGVVERNFPDFRVGDTVSVAQIVKEGNKERTQLFEGDVLAIRGAGASMSFTVRRIASNNIPVERIYPYYSPVISEIKLVRRGDVRRAKLYYVRDRIGKAARIKEKVLTREQKMHLNDKAGAVVAEAGK
ncbi:MAG: large subunit ribosomal protein [Candidatus Dependentiae bacterium]|nr:large subunit ribosomal protein [Candidatus Dependentiae bacterium]